MKRHAIIFIIILSVFQALPSDTGVSAAPGYGSNQQDQDVTLEKSAFSRKKRLGVMLKPSARMKLDLAAKKLVTSLARHPERVDPYALVRREIGNGFGRLSIDQENLLVFYVLAESAAIISGREQIRGGAESMSELSEMGSLRLQMAMDRRSKFMNTLSNMMKKVSATRDAVVQNMK
jgi:hypothetical protein